MIGSLLTRALVLVFGYAYPAYECFKIVELNKPEIEQLRFWCQYWILVAMLTVFERVGDAFISWLPMYSEAKLAFFVYLWYPKTKGTTYVYDTFFRPYVSKHETEIDRNLLELRTRAGDVVVLYWQKAATYSQTRFFEILQYVASQSQSQPSRGRPVQLQQTRQAQMPSAAEPVRQPAVALQQPQPPPTRAPLSPSKRQLQEPAKAAGIPQPSAALHAPQPQTSVVPVSSTISETNGLPAPSEGGEMQVDVAIAPINNDSKPPPPPEDTTMEEAIRLTRGRLRKRAAAAAPSGPSAR